MRTVVAAVAAAVVLCVWGLSAAQREDGCAVRVTLLDEMQRSREFIAGRGVFADDAEKRQVLEVYDQGIADLTARLATASPPRR